MMVGAKYYKSIIAKIIAIDEQTFIAKRKVRENDGCGGYIESEEDISFKGIVYNRKSSAKFADIFGEAVSFTSVAHEKILTLSNSDVKKGDVFTYQNRKLRIRFVNDYFGICKQCDLEVIDDD